MTPMLQQRWQALAARVAALSRRDRRLVLCGLVALAVGLQALWLLPMRESRLAIARATLDDAQQREDVLNAATQERTNEIAHLRQREATLERRLAELGLKAHQREPLAGFVARTLQGHGVTLVTLDAKPAESLELPAPAAAEPGEAQPGVAVADQPMPPTLFRHRTTVSFEGPVTAVLDAIDHLERGLAPLRVETVRLRPAADAAPRRARAEVVLTTISQERSWLAL